MFFTAVVLPVFGREVVKFKSRRLHVPGILEFPSLMSKNSDITQSYLYFPYNFMFDRVG